MTADPRRLGVAVVFLGLLAAGVVLALRSPARSSPTLGAVTTAPTISATTPASPGTSALPSTGLPSTPTTVPEAVSPDTTAATGAPEPPTVVTLQGMLGVVERAFAAWGEFAVTGDIAVVGDTFDLRGPQFGQLAAEAPGLAAAPLGPPPYRFTMTDAVLERPRPQRVVLAGTVTVSRPGEPDQEFMWRVHLRWSGTDWLLWTVEDG